MDSNNPAQAHVVCASPPLALSQHYQEWLETIRTNFFSRAADVEAGSIAVRARSDAVDALLHAVCEQLEAGEQALEAGVAVIALGGYGRRELFPFSDVDLLFLVESELAGARFSDIIARLSRTLWDLGLRVNSMTRTLAQCAHFDPENVEFTLSLIDSRPLEGSVGLARALTHDVVPLLLQQDAKSIIPRLLTVTRNRHARYGNTLFHLEPNTKDCPGGLRDAHVCEWMTRLLPAPAARVQLSDELLHARRFLVLTRTFLHLRRSRDDNTLEWPGQDEAAAVSLGVGMGHRLDAASWMRQYFRHARAVDGALQQFLDDPAPSSPAAYAGSPGKPAGSIHAWLKPTRMTTRSFPPAHPVEGASVQEGDPESILSVFVKMAASGSPLPRNVQAEIQHVLPSFAAGLEDGPKLWRALKEVLLGAHGGSALRTMHALGILELLVPEFHAIDALVIRDAYHRYTVDEHTFVVLDTLHQLGKNPRRQVDASNGMALWASRFGQLYSELAHPELLLLASLLHDTGKGHAAAAHAARSAELAEKVAERLALDRYETTLVVNLVRNHLEMSNTLRRDVSSQDTIRSFTAFAPDPESLRMLTLFTYADIAAVNPGALTPWKAENLWRLYNAATAWLERSVDHERIAAENDSALNDLLMRVHALLPGKREPVNIYLEGFPRRYLQTRAPDLIRTHFELAGRLCTANSHLALDLRYAPQQSELTLISHDRPRLFWLVAGALAAWGMNITSAEAFSNAQGVVVDTFRFTDSFRTLELNESERERFTSSVRGIMTAVVDLDALLAARRRAPRRRLKIQIKTHIEFDNSASTNSTLLQVIAQDTPGLLHALSLTLAEHDCNIEVALIDTEGDAAIDVFYITNASLQLDSPLQEALKAALLEAIAHNAH